MPICARWWRTRRRDLIGFDGITDIYGGNINDPIEVTWFMGRLLGLARPTKATILLLGHPNKAGTSEFLGCGAWENKPRARLYLGPPKKNGDDDEPDLNDPRRVLSRSKANLSGKDALDVIWRDGVFRVADPKLDDDGRTLRARGPRKPPQRRRSSKRWTSSPSSAATRPIPATP